MATSTSVQVVLEQKPERPVFVFRPHVIERSVRYFTNNFRAKVLYAVKTNPEPHVILTLHELGIKNFDVASLEEVRLVKELCPSATAFFMHPVKSRTAIREAYHNYGVRDFSLDSVDELRKILEETSHADDLNLFIRLSIPNTYSELNLSEKFGVDLKEAPALMREARKAARKLGICFHVGSQCMHPDAYRIAIRMAKKVINQAKVTVDSFNVGGGFPSIYPGMVPPAMKDYFDAIHEEFGKANGKNGQMELLCEPGRALVAESTSLIVRVDLRKEDMLYINDGTYGSLFDAGTPCFIFPVKLLKATELEQNNVMPFSFYGPTCDSLDFMKGPFYLPDDVREGDFIEIGQMGAYSRTLASRFNGFYAMEGVTIVGDEPLMTMYNVEQKSAQPIEIIAA